MPLHPSTILGLLAVASVCSAQTEFEVVSIKPNTSMANGFKLNRMPGGGLDAANVTLRMLIDFAYDIRDDQLAGGPVWMETDRYDILARPSREASAAEPTTTAYSEAALNRLHQRVRALLADRFKLVVHSETREMPISVLVVARNGPHLQASTNPGPETRGTSGEFVVKGYSMKMFAERILARRFRRTIVDKTGLSGTFDFRIQYVADPDIAASDTAGPDFLTAMQEQLGLKLEQQKGPVQVTVVEHAEKASAN